MEPREMVPRKMGPRTGLNHCVLDSVSAYWIQSPRTVGNKHRVMLETNTAKSIILSSLGTVVVGYRCRGVSLSWGTVVVSSSFCRRLVVISSWLRFVVAVAVFLLKIVNSSTKNHNESK